MMIVQRVVHLLMPVFIEALHIYSVENVKSILLFLYKPAERFILRAIQFTESYVPARDC